MRVSDSGHSVDLEVLVRTDRSGGLNGSPVGESGLSIVEPGVAEVLDVVVVHVGHAGGELRSVQSAAEREELGTNLLVDVVVVLSVLERLEEVGAATNDFNVVEVVGVDSGQADTAVVHLASENFVTVEVVSEDTGVGVGEVVGIGSGHIDEFSEEGVHRVVLLLDVVEVLGVLVNSVGTEHVFEQKETVVVGVLDRRGIVEDTSVGVDHLVVTDEHQGGGSEGLVGVHGLGNSGLGDLSEGLVDLVNERVVVDTTSSNNHNVVTEVVGSSVASECVGIDAVQLVGFSLDGLSEHVVSVGVEMHVFEGSFLVVSRGGFVLSSNFLLGKLNLCGVEGSVGESVTENGDSSGNVTLEDLETEASLLTGRFGIKMSSHVLNFLSKFGLGAARGSAGEELVQQVRSTSSLESILAGSGADVDTNTSKRQIVLVKAIFDLRGGLRASLFSANSDAIGECRGL